MSSPIMPVDSNPGRDSGDIDAQRPGRHETSSRPPVSLFNNHAHNGLSSEQNSRDSVGNER